MAPKSMDTVIKAIEADPLSDADIKRVLGRTCRIIKYGELTRYNSIEALLPNDIDYVVLLYEDRPNRGHWCCVSKYDQIIELFDPHGGYPDSELLWAPMKTRRRLKENEPH